MEKSKTNSALKKRILILGGAGFIGSNIASAFVKAGSDVVVIDGMLSNTGARKDNLKSIVSNIEFIESRIEDVPNLPEIIAQSDIIIDSMAWAFHRLALDNPDYDLDLNLKSHLYLIQHLDNCKNKKIIYIGSSGQYGNPNIDQIVEDTRMIPEDIQGIHKLAAESYFRVYSKLKGFNVISVRFPNCYGKNQAIVGSDIGLIGLFIRDLLKKKNTTVYGKSRRRFLVYVEDLAEVVLRLSRQEFSGFAAYNLSGHSVLVKNLVKTLIEIIGEGTYKVEELPYELKIIDVGRARFSDDKLRNILGEIPITDFKSSLEITVEYFKKELL